jgi:hypothetical protein
VRNNNEVKLSLRNLISTLSILLLVTAAQSNGQEPQRADRPRTASIGGRVTVGGASAAWDAAARAKLRREAMAAKNEIELQPCGRVKDYALKWR